MNRSNHEHSIPLTRVIRAIIQTHEQVSDIQGITKSADIRTVHRIHDSETGKSKELKHQSPHSFLQESFLVSLLMETELS